MTVNSAKSSGAKPENSDEVELPQEVVDRWVDDLQNHPIRPLNPEERYIYGNAVIRALLQIPAFRSAVGMMRPFMDATCETAYTDQYARVGLSYWFFYGLKTDSERAAVLLHECMHVLNNQFQRRKEIKFLVDYPQMFNYAGDFEINSILERVPMLTLPKGIFPDRDPFTFPPRKTMEFYARCLHEKIKEQEENCPVHGNKNKQNDSSQKSNESEKSDSSKQDSSDSSEDKVNESGDSDKNEENSQPGDQGDPSDQGQPGDQGDQGDPQDGHGHNAQAEAQCNCHKGQKSEDGDGEGEGEGSGNGSGSGQGKGKGGKPNDVLDPGEKGGSKPRGKSKPSIDGDKDWSCDESSEEREQAADEAGIERASDVEQNLARKNTASRLAEERQKANTRSRGLGEGNSWLDAMLAFLQPPVVDWRQLFRRVIAASRDSITRGRSDYSYRRTSRRLQHNEFVFPGMTTYTPKVMMGVDTSGSMGDDDYKSLLNEVESMLKEVARGKEPVTLFAVDTRIGNIQPVTSVKHIKLLGGGGTQMAVAWKFIKELPKREQPDIFVLATDGYIDWADVEAEVRTSKFKSVILVTQEGGFKSCPITLSKLIPVIDISPKEK